MPSTFLVRRVGNTENSRYDGGRAARPAGSVFAAGVVGAVLLAWAAAFAPMATAQGDQADDSGGESQAAIVMDASSSMLEPDEGGTRMDVAKRAATELVDSLPETANVGMLAYGTGVSDAPENQERGCEDIRTLAPVGRVDKDGLKREVDGLQAQGYTPIGNALRVAGDELSGEGERSIILVSDGIDTCAPPPPCEVAKELAGEGIGLAVHVVGFKADEATRQELECIAGETGGSYRQADDAAALTESLKFLTQRAMETYETAGTEFEFADNPDEAKYLGEGLYQTEVTTHAGSASEAEEQFFRVAVPEGMHARVAVTPLPLINENSVRGGQGVGARLDGVNESDSDCTGRDRSTYGSTQAGGFNSAESASLYIDGDDVDGCAMDEWAVQAQFSSLDLGGDSRPENIPVEVSVQFEPALTDEEVAALPAGSSGSAPELSDLPLAEPRPVSGGNSFGNATAITEGTYSDSMVPGETRYYSFPVEWGQRPQVTFKAPPSVRDTNENMGIGIFGPMRNGVADETLHFYDEEKTKNVAVDRSIEYSNRFENEGGKDRALAGTHYVALSMRVDSQDPGGVEQPFEFAVAAPGEPSEGPDWEPLNEPGPEPADTPPSSSGAAHSESADGTDSVNDNDVAASAAGDDDGTNMWLIVGGGIIAAVAAVAAFAAVLLSRGKRRNAADGRWGQPGQYRSQGPQGPQEQQGPQGHQGFNGYPDQHGSR